MAGISGIDECMGFEGVSGKINHLNYEKGASEMDITKLENLATVKIFFYTT